MANPISKVGNRARANWASRGLHVRVRMPILPSLPPTHRTPSMRHFSEHLLSTGAPLPIRGKRFRPSPLPLPPLPSNYRFPARNGAKQQEDAPSRHRRLADRSWTALPPWRRQKWARWPSFFLPWNWKRKHSSSGIGGHCREEEGLPTNARTRWSITRS